MPLSCCTQLSPPSVVCSTTPQLWYPLPEGKQEPGHPAVLRVGEVRTSQSWAWDTIASRSLLHVAPPSVVWKIVWSSPTTQPSVALTKLQTVDHMDGSGETSFHVTPPSLVA